MTMSLLIFLVFLLLILLMLLNNSVIYVISFKFNFLFFSDLEWLVGVWGLLFLFMVLMISTSVMFFSLSYMHSLGVANFVMLYISFVFSMLWLILSGGFYWMMLGWDGLGVVSFMLIVYYMNYESVTNGLFTLFQNRVGDMFFVLFLIGNISMVMSNMLVLKWGLLFLLVGSCVKSAQFPFNSWLLAAMSAPTPISSLVHSSTLVVAGVYILLQYSYCLSTELLVLKYVSLLTLILSMFGLLMESDMKKLIAYSTMSHVALMMYMLSWQLYKVTFFHLNIHAMFKSMMFMCFGFSMLVSFHSQDKRLVSVTFLSPIIKMMYYFSCLCLMGLPMLSGFFSKDFMIEKLLTGSVEMSWSFLLIMFLGVSIYYSFKLMSLVFMIVPIMIVEKSVVGSFSVLMMMGISIMFINIYLSMMLSLSLEIISFKMFIYIVMLIFMLLSILTKMHFKWGLYEKMTNMKEIWMVNVLSVEKFMYWNMFVVYSYWSSLGSWKFIVMTNWWVVLLFLMVWYK